MTDAEALERFEALVLSQQPASAPWQPVTDYSFEARKEIEGKHPELIRDVLGPATVLDYGCGTGALIAMLRFIGVSAKGYEPSPQNTKLEPPTARQNIYRERWALNAAAPFTLVICREVLEHCTVRQIRAIVADLCELSSHYVYVTTRFNLAPQHLLDVMTSDDLDPTHITMLHQDFLRVLFVLEGFKRRADLERQMDWQHKGRVLVYERAA